LEETYIKHWLESKEVIYYKRYVDDILITLDQNVTNEQTIINHVNNINEHLQFKMSSEENNLTNYLDLSIHRNNNNIDIEIHRKPTCTGTTIHFSSKYPYEHKLAPFNYHINRMLALPIMEQSRQQEWKTILTIARNNGFPTHIIHSLRNKLTIKQQQKQNLKKTQQKWIVFTYYSLLLRRITNLSKRTNLRVAFRATNTIFQQLTEKQSQKSSSGIYKLKCNT